MPSAGRAVSSWVVLVVPSLKLLSRWQPRAQVAAERPSDAAVIEGMQLSTPSARASASSAKCKPETRSKLAQPALRFPHVDRKRRILIRGRCTPNLSEWRDKGESPRRDSECTPGPVCRRPGVTTVDDTDAASSYRGSASAP